MTWIDDVYIFDILLLIKRIRYVVVVIPKKKSKWM